MSGILNKFRKSKSVESDGSDTHKEPSRSASRSTDASEQEVYYSHTHGHLHHKKDSGGLEPSEDPVEFVKEALAPIFTFSKSKGLSADATRQQHVPKYFDRGYVHRVNSTIRTPESEGGSLQIIDMLRNRFSTCKIRFKQHTLDTVGKSDLEKATVGLVYEVVSEVKLEDSFHEERRTSVISIFRIEAGKLISGDLVVDTAPFQEREAVNLDCVVS